MSLTCLPLRVSQCLQVLRPCGALGGGGDYGLSAPAQAAGQGYPGGPSMERILPATGIGVGNRPGAVRAFGPPNGPEVAADGQSRIMSLNTILQRLSQDLEDLARARGPLIQHQDAMVCQGHLLRRRPLAAADHADIGGGVMRRAKGTRGDDGGVAAGPAGDTVGASGVQDFGQRHGWQDSGEPTGQYRCACFCRPQQQMIAAQNSTA
jgi:hypothetical protein